MADRKVVFYGAGENAEIKHNFTLKRIGAREPVAFCDRDPRKQGRHFLGLPVVSFADAKTQFGNFDVYVTANEKYAPGIIDYLLKNDLRPENIINYEPVGERKGCASLDSDMTLIFSGDHLEFYHCCIGGKLATFSEASPKTILNNTDFNGDIFSKVLCEKYKLQQDIEQSHPPQTCIKCWWHKQIEYHYTQSKLRKIGMGGFAPCNFSCYNCGNVMQWEKCTYNAWDILLDCFEIIEDSGVMADDCLVTLSLGEHTVAKEHDAVLKRLCKYPLIIYSNAYVWSEPTAEALAGGNTWLRVSVDAGTRATFAKIKGVDGYDRVCENLEHYAKHGTLVLKYILFSGQNDDDADLYGFMELAEKLGAKVNLSQDYGGDCGLSKKTLEKISEIIIHFQDKGKLYGVEFRASEREHLKSLIKKMGGGSSPKIDL